VIETEIKALIEKYKESIDNADTALVSNYGHIPMKFLLYIQEEVNTAGKKLIIIFINFLETLSLNT